jgi:phosphoglycolate phosphatase
LPTSRNDAPPTQDAPAGRFRLILFDCDGTLVDSQHNIVAAMQGAFTHFNLDLPKPAAIRRQVGLSLEAAIERLMSEDRTAIASVHEIAKAYRDIVHGMRGKGALSEPLFEGMRALIEAFDHPALFLGIATGKNLRGLRHTLENHGLTERFHTLQTADLAPSKPHPGMVLKAMAETGCGAQETVVVGDTSFDMEMARSAGAAAIGVTWGYHDSGDLLESGAHFLIDAPGELIGCLQRFPPDR